MKIVIAEGYHEADFIIPMYRQGRNKLIVLNSDLDTAKYLSARNHIQVIHASMTKEVDMHDAGVEGADLFIALSPSDVDNYVACKMAKNIFHVKRVIASVVNPKYVAVFKSLGIDSAISSIDMLAEELRNESSVEDLIKTLSLEDNKIVLIDCKIKATFDVCGKALKDIDFGRLGRVSCIYRHPQALIPDGASVLQEGDKVVIVTTVEMQEQMIAFLQRKRK